MSTFATLLRVVIQDACIVGHCRRPLWMWRRSWTAYKKLQRSSIMKVEAEKFQYWNHFSFFFFLKFGSSKGTIVASVGSCCGSVGRAVASNSRGPQFKSSHRQKLYWTFTVSCIERTKIKKKEAGNCPFFGKKPSEDPITCLSKLFLYCLFTVKMNPSAPVWPGIAIKLSHFPKSCPKSIYLKFVVFPQKLPSIWSLFVRKFVANTYQK